MLKNPADDDHGVGTHDVNDRVAPEAPEMISTDDCVVVPKPDIVHSRLEFDHVIDMRPILNRPVHTATNATQRESSVGISAGELLKYLQHPILIEVAIRKVDFGIGAKLELPALLHVRRVNARASQALQMVLMLVWIEDVNGFIAGVQAVFYERKKDAIFFFIIVEECADVTRLAQLGAGKRNGW